MPIAILVHLAQGKGGVVEQGEVAGHGEVVEQGEVAGQDSKGRAKVPTFLLAQVPLL